ncbi:MAG: HAD family phosphatase [Betaproteobacteria bacterium]
MDAIIFDLGGVLIDWNPRYLYAPVFGPELDAMETFLAQVCPPEWNHQMDGGLPFADAVAERQRQFPHHSDLIALWKDRWPQMLGDAFPETLAILAELRERGHRLIALTNWSAETFPVARQRFGFLDWFEDIVVSGEVRVAKPDPRIFRLALERNRLDAARTVFIDDTRANVVAALALGLTAVHFLDARSLRLDLQRLGLLADSAAP